MSMLAIFLALGIVWFIYTFIEGIIDIIFFFIPIALIAAVFALVFKAIV